MELLLGCVLVLEVQDSQMFRAFMITIVGANSLLNFKILRFKIAVIPSILSSEPEYAVIRISYTLWIIHFVAMLPDDFLRCTITQNFHGAPKHNTLEESFIKEIYASFRVFEILPYSHRGRISREEDMLYAFPFSWWKHCL